MLIATFASIGITFGILFNAFAAAYAFVAPCAVALTKPCKLDYNVPAASAPLIKFSPVAFAFSA